MVVVSQRGIKIMTNITLSRDVQDRNSIFFLPMILSLRNKAFQGGRAGGVVVSLCQSFLRPSLAW